MKKLWRNAGIWKTYKFLVYTQLCDFQVYLNFYWCIFFTSTAQNWLVVRSAWWRENVVPDIHPTEKGIKAFNLVVIGVELVLNPSPKTCPGFRKDIRSTVHYLQHYLKIPDQSKGEFVFPLHQNMRNISSSPQSLLIAHLKEHFFLSHQISVRVRGHIFHQWVLILSLFIFSSNRVKACSQRVMVWVDVEFLS